MIQPLTLVAMEVAHIQSYIFNSNRLKENIGASHLVAASTGTWACDAVRQVTKRHNLTDGDGFQQRKHLERDTTLDVEVLYWGGGNFVCLFREPETAQAFARVISSKVLFEAPGLHLVVHSSQIEPNEPLALAVGRVLRELKHARGSQPLPIGIAGLGVTAMCDSTSLPAVTLTIERDKTRRIYSAETAAKIAFAEHANTTLRRLISLDNHFRYPFDFDDLGRTEGEKSFIAVVHADGNGLGRLVAEIAHHFGSTEKNTDYIDALRTFSENVKHASNQALNRTVRILQDAFDEDGQLRYHFSGQAPLKLKRDEDNRLIFPLRPLIFGGDDVTFVCDGRIGIALAHEFVRQFEFATGEVFASPLSACAGVAIIKTHYPFARGYDLSEELCQSAKTFARSLVPLDAPTPSAIDWHFTTGGLYGELKEMRARDYPVPPEQKSLTLRPVLIGDTLHPYRRWSLIERAVTAFQTGLWSGSRSKAKALAGVIRQGEGVTAAYQARYLRDEQLTLPDLPDFAEKAGWHDGFCGYFDALELLDLYVPIIPAKEEQGG